MENHRDEWPVMQLLLGNFYDKEQLLSILHQPVLGRISLLALQLLLKLNIERR